MIQIKAPLHGVKGNWGRDRMVRPAVLPLWPDPCQVPRQFGTLGSWCL